MRQHSVTLPPARWYPGAECAVLHHRAARCKLNRLGFQVYSSSGCTPSSPREGAVILRPGRSKDRVPRASAAGERDSSWASPPPFSRPRCPVFSLVPSPRAHLSPGCKVFTPMPSQELLASSQRGCASLMCPLRAVRDAARNNSPKVSVHQLCRVMLHRVSTGAGQAGAFPYLIIITGCFSPSLQICTKQCRYHLETLTLN